MGSVFYLLWIILSIGYSAGAIAVALTTYENSPFYYMRKIDSYIMGLIWPLVVLAWIAVFLTDFMKGVRHDRSE